jgi:TfoX/Sxy family transcriptional regulator of competence genes
VLYIPVRRPDGDPDQDAHKATHAEAMMARKRLSMPKSDPQVAALFRSLLPGDDRVMVRPMFGYAAAFVNGNMFAGTFGGQVFVRLAEPLRTELLAVAGATPFAPMPGRPMKDYVQLPPKMLGDRSAASAWVQRALESTSALPPKAAGGSRKRSTPRATAPARRKASTHRKR